MTRIKIVTFVPIDHADAVRDAMGSAGAGVIGKYTPTRHKRLLFVV